MREREASFNQIDFKSPEIKHQYGELMQLQYMSSEESGEDDMIMTHPLSWLSPKATKFISRLDDHRIRNQSAQSKRQSKKRCKGTPTVCPRPSGSQWLFKN